MAFIGEESTLEKASADADAGTAATLLAAAVQRLPMPSGDLPEDDEDPWLDV